RNGLDQAPEACVAAVVLQRLEIAHVDRSATLGFLAIHTAADVLLHLPVEVIAQFRFEFALDTLTADEKAKCVAKSIDEVHGQTPTMRATAVDRRSQFSFCSAI